MNGPNQTTRQHFTAVKVPLHLYNIKIKALGHGVKPNIALGFALCYISLSPTPLCFYFHIVRAAVL